MMRGPPTSGFCLSPNSGHRNALAFTLSPFAPLRHERHVIYGAKNLFFLSSRRRGDCYGSWGFDGKRKKTTR